MLACQYFFHYELPKIGAWLQVVARCDTTCADMPEDAF
jgi:butyryl-CoA dehydrogenase